MNIIVQPEQVVEYFLENYMFLRGNLNMIASNEDGSVEIYLTEHRDKPVFQVEMDGKEVYCKAALNGQDAEEEYRKIIYVYLSDDDDYVQDENVFVEEYEESEPVEPKFNEVQVDRLTDISCAVDDLVTVLIEGDPEKNGIQHCDLMELAENVSQFLHDKWGFSVWMPMVMESAGELFIEEYPYDNDDTDEESVPS